MLFTEGIAREKSPLAPLYEKGGWGDYSATAADAQNQKPSVCPSFW